jgi:hypothetical protein
MLVGGRRRLPENPFTIMYRIEERSGAETGVGVPGRQIETTFSSAQCDGVVKEGANGSPTVFCVTRCPRGTW